MDNLKPITKRDGSGLHKSVIAVQSLDGDPSVLWNLYKNGNKYYLATCDDILRLPTNWKVIDEFELDAIDFSIVFDGSWIFIDGRWKLQTENVPYLFWVTALGELKVKKYGSDEVIDLATGVNSISALRGWKNTIIPSHDHGLIVSYVKSGTIYYRAYCYQELTEDYLWETEREVEYLTGVVDKASLFLLNDYRVGFSIVDNSGNRHWLISERNWAGMAIAPEYVQITVIGDVKLVGIEMINVITSEFVSTNVVGEILYLYALSDYSFNSIENISLELFDENEQPYQNWGYKIRFTVSHDFTVLDLSDFSLNDSNNSNFIINEIVKVNSKEFEVNTVDFNNAYGDMTLTFNGEGNSKGEVGQNVDSFMITFTPQNLVPSFIPLPEVEEVWNE